jgi:two-component system cell cycle response regulator DivK
MTKILLVEDNEMGRDMLSRRLMKKGYEVVLAADGEQGVERARTESPDLILMDMRFDTPGIDGWEATQLIKAQEATASIPIIALTAYAMEGDREKTLAVGCDDYDSKPVEFSRLVSKIEALLTRSASA